MVARRKRVAHLAKAQQRAQRAKGQAMQGERSELCDGGLKVIEKERGKEEENKGGEGLRAASASLT